MIKKYTVKDIKEIRNATPDCYAYAQISKIQGALKIGYARKASANWQYGVWAIPHKSGVCLVVETFGEILGNESWKMGK